MEQRKVRQRKAKPIKAKPVTQNGRWTQAEKQKFDEAYEMFGKNWKKIKQYVGTRTGT